jgi:hypothetical protein
MLISQQGRAEIFDYLWWLETQHMGLTGDRQATEKFADRLLEIPSEVESAGSGNSVRGRGVGVKSGK